MRHFLRARAPADPIPGLPGGMAKPPRATVLIAAAGLPAARAAGPLSARSRAVPIASITVPTEKEQSAAIAARTDHEPEGVQASRVRHAEVDNHEAVCENEPAESRPCDSARGPGVCRLRALTLLGAVSGNDLP